MDIDANFLIVAYFTTGTLYEIEVKRLIQSCLRFKVPYYVKPISDLGSWYLNTQYKPRFLRDMLEKFPNKSLVYLDVDAEFLQYPQLFETYCNRRDVHIAVHLLDHQKRGRANAAPELLSGTVFLKNSSIVREIVSNWEKECRRGGMLWDQSALAKVLEGQAYQILPEEYCTIFDYMSDVKEPVIRHYQASRKVGNKSESLSLPTYRPEELPLCPLPVITTAMPPKPRRVERGGLVRYSRKWRNR